MLFWVAIEFILGCLLLAWGADRFIAGSVGIAKRFGLSQLVIGVVLIGFGTTFPEIVVAVIASVHHKPDLAIGNAVGSCITNIGLVLSLTLCVTPILVQSSLLKREFPVLLIISTIVGLLLYQQDLTRLDGLLLLVVLAFYLYFLMALAPKDKQIKQVVIEEANTVSAKVPLRLSIAVMWWFVGLILLFVSSELIVDAASRVARWLHVSDLIIGLTIVAIGTSLPELAATIITAKNKQYDIAMGNIIGSNVFNILAVLAVPALISPSKLSAGLLYRDYPAMIFLTLLLWGLSVVPSKKSLLSWGSGLVLMISYALYMFWLVTS